MENNIEDLIKKILDIDVTINNGVYLFTPVSKRGEDFCAMYTGAKFGKAIMVPEKYYTCMLSTLLKTNLCIVVPVPHAKLFKNEN